MPEGTSNRKFKPVEHLLTPLAALLIIIPLAPFICRFIPPIMLGEFNIDLIISVLISIVIVRVLMWLIRPLVIPALLIIVALLVFNQLAGRYGFDNVFYDYKTLAYSNWKVREQKQADLLSFNPGLFENQSSRGVREIKEKVLTKDSLVRNFAVQHSLDHFKEYQAKYGMLTRYFSLFKYINNHFNYVSDVRRDEYFATPHETITNGMGGDCDDHSILMASCLNAIGARCRLVVVEGHMYPELYAGDEKDFNIMQQAIVQLFNDQKIKSIFYHEHDGEYWINLDYTAKHPGGFYMNDQLRMMIDF